MQEHQARVTEYERDLIDWKRKKIGAPPKKPEEPVADRFIVSDVTVEALALLLRNAPRGVLLARDELVGWIGGFDRYRQGRGADAHQFLEMHRAGRLIVDRKTGDHRTITVPRAAVSICGGTGSNADRFPRR